MDRWDFDRLCRKADEWKRQASDLDFLGEVALSQAELESVLRAVGLFHRRVAEPALSFALAVAAVNWAYWRGVDEEESNGFRDAFMSHSLGYCDLRVWEGVWGPAIESAICGWSKQAARSGAYRYVGLILRHAGVPHAKIPKLAQLLQELDDRIGWENLPFAPDAAIQGHVASCFGSGCVREHLMSEAGLAYVRSLCADVLLVTAQPSRSSTDLPGYRPGLLAELLTHLRPGHRPPASPAFPLPYVTFDPASGRIELVFDERLVRRRDPIQCDQWRRRLFDARIDVGPGGIEPAPTYNGRLPDGRAWSTKGWRYSDRGAWALFRTDGRLFTTHSHDESVSAGDYLLLVVPASGIDVRSHWPEAGDGGERYLPDGTECHLWHVTLCSGDDGKLPHLRVAASGHPWLQCVNGGALTRWTQLDAVCAEAPRVHISGWTTRTSRRFRLIVTTAGVSVRDLNPPVSESGDACLVLSDLPVGLQAEVSLSPIGFQHGPRLTQTLRVVRFPGSVEVEHGLWPLAEPVRLQVAVSGEIELETDAADAETQVLREGGRIQVAVAPSAHCASLRAVAAGASLPLRIPVRRCSFCASDAPGTPALFDRLSLRQMCDLTSPCQAFTLSAVPGTTVDLLVRDRRGLKRTWRRGLRLGSNGRLEFRAAEIIDIARGETGILELLVRCDGLEVPTGSLFVEPVHDDLDTGPWPQAVLQYLQLLRQPLAALEHLNALAQAPCLHRHAILIARADHAFGLSTVLPNPKTVCAAPGWIAELQQLLADPPKAPGAQAKVWKEALAAWLKAAPVPFCPVRWGAALASRIADVDRRVDVSRPLARMLAGECDPSVPDGLMNGWGCYVEGAGSPPHDERLLIQTNNYFSAAARGAPPWNAIAQRLSAWTLLRAGAVPEFCKAVVRMSESEHCRELTATLRGVAALLAMNALDDNPREPGGLERCCREDDRLLAAAVGGNAEAWTQAADRCWLAAWLAWRRCVIMGLNAEHREACRRTAMTQLDKVPGRAFETVSEELRSGVPRPIKAEMEFA